MFLIVWGWYVLLILCAFYNGVIELGFNFECIIVIFILEVLLGIAYIEVQIYKIRKSLEYIGK